MISWRYVTDKELLGATLEESMMTENSEDDLGFAGKIYFYRQWPNEDWRAALRRWGGPRTAQKPERDE